MAGPGFALALIASGNCDASPRRGARVSVKRSQCGFGIGTGVKPARTLDLTTSPRQEEVDFEGDFVGII